MKCTRQLMFLFSLAILAVAMVIVPVQAATIVDDFSGGVTAVSHPDPSGVFGTWYDITNDAFGSSAASTLSGSPAMVVNDGGFTNGVYAIYESVVPADGVYTASVDMMVNDTETSDMTNYQIGVVVNGVHRSHPGDLAVVSGPGTGVASYAGLTADALDATTIQTLTTNSFSASAGDNLLVAFSTSVDAADFDSNSGFWNDASVTVDNIMLNLVPEPASFVLALLAGLGLVSKRRR